MVVARLKSIIGSTSLVLLFNAAFKVQVAETSDSKRKKLKPSVATREAYLINDIISARKLEEQLLSVQTLVLEGGFDCS